MLLRLTILGIVSWTLPQQAWRPLRHLLMRLQGQRAPYPALQAAVEQILGRSLTLVEARELEYRFAAGDYDDALRILRCYRPGGWRPDIVLDGEFWLQRELAAGHGVVLWVGYCSGSRLVTKMALDRAGYSIHHLSRPSHGFSATPFGIRYLNRYWQRIENRYLAERIVMGNDNNISVMKRLKALLKDNQIVSITDHAKAKQHSDIPFLGGFRSLATGPANLALSSGATLLSVFCREHKPGCFTVTIAPPLAADAERTRQRLMQHYSETLAAFVEQYPHQWQGWWWDPGIRPAAPDDERFKGSGPRAVASG